MVEAIESGSVSALEEELGDLLLQVVFHAQMQSEAGRFDFEDVARGISDKLVRRHPHVFGERSVADADEVLSHWDAIKKQEKAAKGVSVSDASVLAGCRSRYRHYCGRMRCRSGRVVRGLIGCERGDVLDKLQEELVEVRDAVAAQDERGVAGGTGRSAL